MLPGFAFNFTVFRRARSFLSTLPPTASGHAREGERGIEGGAQQGKGGIEKRGEKREVE